MKRRRRRASLRRQKIGLQQSRRSSPKRSLPTAPTCPMLRGHRARPLAPLHATDPRHRPPGDFADHCDGLSAVVAAQHAVGLDARPLQSRFKTSARGSPTGFGHGARLGDLHRHGTVTNESGFSLAELNEAFAPTARLCERTRGSVIRWPSSVRGPMSCSPVRRSASSITRSPSALRVVLRSSRTADFRSLRGLAVLPEAGVQLRPTLWPLPVRRLRCGAMSADLMTRSLLVSARTSALRRTPGSRRWPAPCGVLLRRGIPDGVAGRAPVGPSARPDQTGSGRRLPHLAPRARARCLRYSASALRSRWIDIVTHHRGRVGPCATGKPRFDASVAHRTAPMFTRRPSGPGHHGCTDDRRPALAG